MRDYQKETELRVAFIKEILKESGAKGIVYGNSGGKDCTLVGILSKMAEDNTVGIILPCSSKRNYGEDADHARAAAEKFKIQTRIIDLTDTKKSIVSAVEKVVKLEGLADANINPRLRMIALYAVAAAENRVVAGTGNRSEGHMGYFTKWGDGAYDFNPIADLTVREVYEFLEYLNAPKEIIEKAPSAGLYEGQTDEKEMGISYSDIDNYLMDGVVSEENLRIINRYHQRSEHKRRMPRKYGDKN